VNRIVVVGVGLIGGSFAAGVRKAGFRGEIIGVSSPEVIRQALEKRLIDAGATLEEAVPEADLVYLSQPISEILKTIAKLDPLVKPEALVTDAGSTKVRIVAAAKRKLKRCIFIGGHPMAGKEQRGVAAADPSLFQGRTYFLVPPAEDGGLQSPQARLLRDWLLRLGALPHVIPADEHDSLVALTSHLPQLVSTALALTAGAGLSPDQLRTGAGPGLLDMTRLAGSPYEIWRDILDTNREEVDAVLNRFIRTLQKIRKNLGSEGLETQFRKAEQAAHIIRQGGIG
jgi:prephenate dehydrogenase